MKRRPLATAILVSLAFMFTACDSRPEAMAQAANKLYSECGSGILPSCFKALSFFDSIEILSPKDRYRFGQAVGFGNSPESFAKTNIELTKECHASKQGQTATSCIKALTLVSIVAKMPPEEKKRFEDAGGFQMPSEDQNPSKQPSESVEGEPEK